MSWIKKTMGRLFGSQSEETIDESANSPQIQQKPEETETPPRKAFRFPMITDAEIYGWEEEPGDHPPAAHDLPLITDEEPFERATPLYKNNRWPAEPPAGEIHRAGSRTKYGPAPEPSAGARKAGAPVPPERKQPADRKQQIQEKRIHTPFKPTEVPSPVYGFSKPKRTAFNVRQQVTEHELPVPGHRKDDRGSADPVRPPIPPSPYKAADIPAQQDIPAAEPIDKPAEGHFRRSEPAKPQIQPDAEQTTGHEWSEPAQAAVFDRESEPPSEDILSADEPVSPEPLLSEPAGDPDSEERQAFAAPLTDEVEKTVEVEQNSEEGPRFEEGQAIEEVQLIEEEAIAEARVAVLQEAAEPKNPGITAAETPAHDLSETAVLEEPAEPAEGQQEKIVPFNVLMLSSDKKRMLWNKPALDTPSAAEPVLTDPIPAAQPRAEREPVPVQQAIQPETVQMAASTPAPDAAAAVSVADWTEAGNGQTTVADPEQLAARQPEAVIVAEPSEEVLPHYVYPSMDDLLPPESQQEDQEWLDAQSEKLVEALSHFSVQADILEAVQGPTVTRFELTVGFGTKVSKVRNLTDDLKLALAAEDIRIQAPIPGTSSIGIEIPNRKTRPVRISEVIGTEAFTGSESPLEAVLGLSLTGDPVTLDLRKMPHGMIAGATGSGKSVCINSILVSLLYKASPADVKLMLIDPKMVELAPFNGVPHLISPVITDVKAATAALKWAVDEMERRYELFAHAGARNIERYNRMAEDNRQFSLKMPYLLIVIDELADLMMVAPSDVEVSISRIAQKARACGIHLIIATQRPSVDVITGIIKANIPTRIAFAVSSQVDSRTIIDAAGAERLLGRGDMLYIGNGQSSPIRLQGTFVTDDEIEQIIEHVKNEASPEYLFGQEDLLAAAVEEEESDPLFTQACSFIIEQGSASTSLLQRHFSIGYNRAAKLMDRMETHGFISEQRGSRPRDVYVTQADLDAFLNPQHEA